MSHQLVSIRFSSSSGHSLIAALPVFHITRKPNVPTATMSAEDFPSNNNPGRRRKRNRNQSPEARKKPRLDEGTSHPVQAKKQLQQATISVLKYLGKRPDTFVYPPLEEKNGQEIRVLIIEPGKGDDEIRCKLVPAALPKSDPSDTEKYVYIALSYNWGEGQPIHPITITNYITSRKRMKEPSLEKRLAMKFRKHKDWCSSGEKYVRSNLFVALKRFRRKDKETIMWIDALCIDQDDPHERSAQVKQMHELYIQAELPHDQFFSINQRQTWCPGRLQPF